MASTYGRTDTSATRSYGSTDLVVLARTAIDDAGLERDVENRDVLNGIAWLGADQSDSGGRYYLTGKRWPLLFEVDFLER
mgnify:CR=1 FL=1